MTTEYKIYQLHQVHSAISQAPAYHLQSVLDESHNPAGGFASQAAAEVAIEQLLSTQPGPYTVLAVYLP